MGPQRRLGIYVGFDSPSIIRYLEPVTGDMFTARFADCQFDETVFPSLGGDKNVINIPEERRELTWNTSTLSHLDPRTSQCDYEIRRILHLQEIANQLPDSFNDAAKVTKSHVPAMNVPARIDVPAKQTSNTAANESVARLKRGRPVGSKDSAPRKRRIDEKSCPNKAPEKAVHNTPEEVMYQKPNLSETSMEDTTLDKVTVPEETMTKVPNNDEISIFHTDSGEIWEINKFVIDDIFTYVVATEISKGNDENDEIEPRSINECRQRNDWLKWKTAIQAELDSLKNV